MNRIFSMDIWDTLLIRDVARPSDVFRAIGGEEFARWRRSREAELNARGAHPNIYDIYGGNTRNAEREIAYERDHATVNPKALEKLTEARKWADKIVLISDMYLPRKATEEILAHAGIYQNAHYDNVYVSCDYKCSKHDGTLYNKVNIAENVAYSDWTHVGDNQHSDVDVPRSRGIAAEKWTSPMEALFARLPELRKNNPSIGFSRWAARLAYDGIAHKRKGFGQLGYDTACIPHAYAAWLIDQAIADKRESMLFCLRDGYLFKHFFDRFSKGKIMSIFAFANRAMKLSGKDYADYAKSLDFGRMGIVDNCATAYSSAQVLDAIRDKIIYLMIARRPSDRYTVRSFDPEIKEKGFCGLSNFDIAETLMSAPMPPYNDVVNGEPVYVEPSEDEEERIKAVAQICEAALEYDAPKEAALTFEEMKLAFRCVLASLPKDMQARLHNTKFAPGADNATDARALL